MKNNGLRILFICAFIIVAQSCSKKDDSTSTTPNYNNTNNNNYGINLTLGSNSPVSVGGTLNLTASTISGAYYSWTGPASFSSSAQNPARSNFALVDTGTYSCNVTTASYQNASATVHVSAL